MFFFACFWGHFDTIKVAQVGHFRILDRKGASPHLDAIRLDSLPHLILIVSKSSFWTYKPTSVGSDCGHSGRRCSPWESAPPPGHRHRDRWRQQRQQQLSPAPNRWALAKGGETGSGAPGGSPNSLNPYNGIYPNRN